MPRKSAKSAAVASAQRKSRGTRLPAEWVLPKPWGDWAIGEMPGWTPDTVRNEAAKFADFWHAKTGRDATKADWLATWRNWCRNAKQTTLQRNAGSDRKSRQLEGAAILTGAARPAPIPTTLETIDVAPRVIAAGGLG